MIDDALVADAEKAVKDRDAAIQKVVSKLGNVFLDVSEAGIKWTYEYQTDRYTGSGIGKGRRARFHSTGYPLKLVAEISPQDSGNFYPHKMPISEFIDAVGGVDKFNQMLVAAIKTAAEGAKKTRYAVEDFLI